MTAPQSTKKAKRTKPAKPKKDYPLFPHASGQWAKKVKGRILYFGIWDDPDAALTLWLHEKDYHYAGVQPPPIGETAITVGHICQMKIDSINSQIATGEKTVNAARPYVRARKRIEKFFGKNTPVKMLTPERFAALRTQLAKDVSLKTLEGRIAEIRAIFNHAKKNGKLTRPTEQLWGTQFNKPSLDNLEAESDKKGDRILTADEIKSLLAHASPTMKAMILLGINCGYGNTDCGQLEFRHIDDGYAVLRRGKTKRKRRCPLWPETKKAIEDIAGERTERLVFVTKYGNTWQPQMKDSKAGKQTYTDPIAQEFAKLRKRASVSGYGKTFYTLRHMFQTIGDETLDFVCVMDLMGHKDTTISAKYRGDLTDARRKKVTQHIRKWLFGKRGAK